MLLLKLRIGCLHRRCMPVAKVPVRALRQRVVRCLEKHRLAGQTLLDVGQKRVRTGHVPPMHVFGGSQLVPISRPQAVSHVVAVVADKNSPAPDAVKQRDASNAIDRHPAALVSHLHHREKPVKSPNPGEELFGPRSGCKHPRQLIGLQQFRAVEGGATHVRAVFLRPQVLIPEV